MDEFHSPLAQRVDVQMAARSAEIIDPGNLESGIKIEQAVGKIAPRETADSGEENFHFGALVLICSPV